jgi:ribonuclease Z
MTEVIPLGTSSAVPTRDRHFSATAVQYEGDVLLFDCGEGTQIQLLRAGVKQPRLVGIFITHFHGDHYFGLMGLLNTLALVGYEHELTISGPAGIGRLIDGLPGQSNERLPFPVRYVELPADLTHQVVLDTPAYTVEARPLEHSVFTAGYRFQEKDRPGNLDVEKAGTLGITDYRDYQALKAGRAVTLADGQVVRPEAVVGPRHPGAAFAYVTDSRPCDGGRALAHAANLLYHEATFIRDDQERAYATRHSTAAEAAEVARDAGADRLLIGHFSARYRDAEALVIEARTVFKNSEAAEELKRYPLTPPLLSD